MSRKICLCIGHGSNAKGVYDPGAVSKDKKYHEHKLARKIAKYAADYLGCDLVNYGSDKCLTKRIKAVNAGNYGFAADIHLNAGGGTGTEVYYYHGSPTGKKAAAEISKSVSSDLGVRNRGPKVRLNAYGKDYFGFIRLTDPCAVLIECVFIDCENDLEKVRTEAGCKKCGVAIGKALEKVFGDMTEYTVLTETQIKSKASDESKVKGTLLKGDKIVITVTSSDGKWGRLKDGRGWVKLGRHLSGKAEK
ncbi:MAG: N-acetylmuramoyl-L-alanine amidase [Clostridia bacterium]|nr:N-acetylmuramoyl-L-alanine amidase [Clostridia bacterium]